MSGGSAVLPISGHNGLIRANAAGPHLSRTPFVNSVARRSRDALERHYNSSVMAAPDSQRVWFPEMTERLRSQWHRGEREPADSRAQGRHIGAK